MTSTDRARRPAAATRHPRRRLGPGLLVAGLGTLVAVVLNRAVPAVSALTAAVVLGVLAGPLLPAVTRAGLAWTTRRLLRAGVVLLGLQLSLRDLAHLGWRTVLAVAVTVLVGFMGTRVLGRLIGVPPRLRLLVATGFCICGASAVAAMGAVTDGDEEDVATAVTLVTLYGSLAIAGVPLLGHVLRLTPTQLGAWAGISVHEVAQVVAAASPAGAAAVGTAVLVKLTRVVMLAPIVAGVSVARRRTDPVAGTGRRPPLVPLFVLGFLAMTVLRSTGVLPTGVLDPVKTLSTVLFAAALLGLGTGVALPRLLRSGRRALALGAASTLLVAGVGLGTLTLAGAA